MQEVERAEVWDDGLHFSPAGYQRLGEMVAARLAGILEDGAGRVEKGFEAVAEEVDEGVDGDEASASKEKQNAAKTGGRKVEDYDDDFP